MTTCVQNDNGYTIGYDSGIASNPIDAETNVVISFNDKFSNVPFAINTGGTNMVVSNITDSVTNFYHIAMQPYNNMIMNFNIKDVGDTRSRNISYMVCDFYIIPYYHSYDNTSLNLSTDYGLLEHNTKKIFENPTDITGEFITKYVINDTLLGSQYPRYVYTCNYIKINKKTSTTFIDTIINNNNQSQIYNPVQPQTSIANTSSFISSNVVSNIPQVIILNKILYTKNDLSFSTTTTTTTINPNKCLTGGIYDEIKGIYIPKTEAIITSGTIVLENPVSYTDVADSEIYIQCNPTPDEKGDKMYSEIVGSAADTDLSKMGLMNYFSTFMIVLIVSLVCYLSSEFVFTKLIFEVINPNFKAIKHGINGNINSDNKHDVNNLDVNQVSGAIIILIFTTIIWGTTILTDSTTNQSTTEFTVGWALIIIVFMMCFVIINKQSSVSTQIYFHSGELSLSEIFFGIMSIFNYISVLIYNNPNNKYIIGFSLSFSIIAFAITLRYAQDVKYYPILSLFLLYLPALHLYLNRLYYKYDTN